MAFFSPPISADTKYWEKGGESMTRIFDVRVNKELIVLIIIVMILANAL